MQGIAIQKVPKNQDMVLLVARSQTKSDPFVSLLAIPTLKWWEQTQLNAASMEFGMKIHPIATVSSFHYFATSAHSNERSLRRENSYSYRFVKSPV